MKIRFLKEQFIECCIGFDEIIGVEFGNGTVSFLNKEDIEIED